jgi:hypothetical protein
MRKDDVVEEGSETLYKGRNLGIMSSGMKRDYLGKENEIFLLKEKTRSNVVKVIFYSSRIPGI